MIFASEVKLTPGTIVEKRWWRTPEGPPRPCARFFIIREATRIEWENWVRADLGDGASLTTPGKYFYEVSTD